MHCIDSAFMVMKQCTDNLKLKMISVSFCTFRKQFAISLSHHRREQTRVSKNGVKFIEAGPLKSCKHQAGK